jgi:amino acid adenylation domain-containing protein
VGADSLTGVGVAAPTSLQAAFARQAALTPDAIALRGEGASWTYRELDRATNRIARRLAGLGLRPQTPAAVTMERSTLLVRTLLAVAKAGAFHLPLPPGLPPDRVRRIAAESGTRVLLADRAARTRGLVEFPTVYVLDDDGDDGDKSGAADAESDEDPAVPGHPEHLAHVMYTSGTTGVPKGVAVTHRNVLDLAADRMFGRDEHSRVLMIASYSFDPSTYEVWVPLLNGGCTVVAPEGLEHDLAGLARILAAERVSALQLTAGLFRAAADEHPDCFAGLREVITGGDVVSPEAVRRVLRHAPDLVVRSAYGPTETTLFATQARWTAGTEIPAPVPIGGPLDGMRARVLDDRLRPVPDGARGELYLSGAGLARGYLGAPALTAERFVAAVDGPPGTRMYRTGDLVCRAPSGRLDFLGRRDGQVKIRGFRVEPGEVEAALDRVTGLRAAFVAAQADRTGEKQLVAYYTLDSGGPGLGVACEAAQPRAEASSAPDPAALRRALASRLPEYMIPAAFVRLDSLPLTGSGKIDRAALPDPFAGPRPRSAAEPGGAARAPRSPVEDVLCGLFAEVLGGGPVGAHDSFFELGGDSLLAIRLASRVHSVLGVKVSLRTMLAAPTAAQLCATLVEADRDGGALAPLLPLRSSGSRPPLFCVHPSSGLAWSYAGLLRYVPRDYPVYGLQADGLEPGFARPATMDALIDAYAARIRTVRPHGPYLLFGWSLGGQIAQRLAARLAAQGEHVPLLVVLDADPVGRGAAPDLHTPDGLLRAAFDGVAALDGAVGLPGPERIRWILGGTGGALGSLNEQAIGAILEITAHHFRLSDAAPAPQQFDGDMILITGTGQPDAAQAAAAWSPYVTGRIDVHGVVFEHLRLMSPEALAEIGPLLSRSLRSRPSA